MFRMKRQTRTERVTEVLKEAASYTDRLAHDRRLRSDVKSAIDHGAIVTRLLRRDIRSSQVPSRVAADKRLRKSLRAFVNDIASATGRVQRKRRSHRVRNALLLVGGTGAAVAAGAKGRRWIVRTQQPEAVTPAY